VTTADRVLIWLGKHGGVIPADAAEELRRVALDDDGLGVAVRGPVVTPTPVYPYPTPIPGPNAGWVVTSGFITTAPNAITTAAFNGDPKATVAMWCPPNGTTSSFTGPSQ
jgi:hypothetical protein